MKKCKNIFCCYFVKNDRNCELINIPYNLNEGDLFFFECKRRKEFDKYYFKLSEHEKKIIKKFEDFKEDI